MNSVWWLRISFPSRIVLMTAVQAAANIYDNAASVVQLLLDSGADGNAEGTVYILVS